MSYFRFALFIIFMLLNAVSPTASWAFDANFITHESRGAVSPTKAQQIVDLVHQYSQEYGVNPQTVFKVMRVESRYNPKAKSNHNAVGLMQIIPYWHRDKLKGKDPYNIATNIKVGVQVLAEYIEQTGSEVAGLRRYCGGDRSYAKLVKSVKYIHYDQPYEKSTHSTYARARPTPEAHSSSDMLALAVMTSDVDMFPKPKEYKGLYPKQSAQRHDQTLGYRERYPSDSDESDII